ncbi:MAG TPA: beta-ketoacyl-ACP synthase II [Alcanivoracaceae bacterium]|nr:beta-ketoacyl-ACP synthase II [Alcanivoracaceae bacterium]
MTKRRVVVTGLGLLCPLGADVASSWAAIKAGKSGITKLDHFDTSEFTTQIGGVVPEFDLQKYITAREARRVDPFVQYGMVAAMQAIQDAGLYENEEINKERVGVAIGSGIGGLTGIEENHKKYLESGPRRFSPFFVPGNIINILAGTVSIMFGFRGPNFAIATACSTGTHSIGLAAQQIQLGQADVMIAGGSEKATCPLGLGGFGAARALSTRNDEPTKASRPWDTERDGFVMADGSGVVVLESLEHAQARGAKIYGEVAGFGMSGDAYHITSPPEDGSGAALAMKNALLNSGLQAEDLQYINAHGTSTQVGDLVEIKAIRSVYGAHADNLAVSSTKSMVGHMLGAAGAVEAIFTLLAMQENIAPPTINLDNPDDGCDLNLVPHEAQQIEIQAAMSNSFGFGGTNASLVFRKL